MSDSAAHDEPLSGPALVLTGLMLAAANFMVVLDTTIANVAVPHIAGGLAISPSEGTWIITSYGVAEAIVVPLTGWLSQRFGTARVFVVAMALFGLCSALCGLATSIGALVVFRVAQGMSGAPMIPLSQVLLRRVFPPEQQGRALGLWSMTTVAAPVLGPVLGGTICDNIGWEWAFYINVPIAFAVAAMAWPMLRRWREAPRPASIDGVGLAMLVTWVGALQILLDRGQELDWFNSGTIVVLAAVATTGFLAFLVWELTGPEPIVDLRVFRNTSFSFGVATLSLAYSAFFASIVLLPLWLQTQLGYTATWAGYATAFNGMFAIVMSPIVASVLMKRIDPRLLVSFGLVVLALTSLLRGRFPPDIDFGHIVLPQLLQGFAMPFFFVPLTAITLSSLPAEQLAAGTGLMNFVRTTAAAFAASLTTTAWANAATRARADLAGHVTSFNPATTNALGSLQSTGMPLDTALGTVDRIVNGQAVMIATNRVFAATSLLFLLGACAVWVARRPSTLDIPSH